MIVKISEISRLKVGKLAVWKIFWTFTSNYKNFKFDCIFGLNYKNLPKVDKFSEKITFSKLAKNVSFPTLNPTKLNYVLGWGKLGINDDSYCGKCFRQLFLSIINQVWWLPCCFFFLNFLQHCEPSPQSTTIINDKIFNFHRHQ